MAWREGGAEPAGSSAGVAAFEWTPDRFNARVREIPVVRRAGTPPAGVISLAFGMPDPILFPAAGLAEAAREAMADAPACAVALQYGPIAGNPVLLAELARKLEEEEGRKVVPGTLAITSGSSQAIPLVVQALANPGDVVLSEAPTFLGTIRHMQFHGVRIECVPLDAEGLDVEAVEERLRRLEAAGTPPRFLYTIPTFNNPAGVTMSLARRRALLDLAARHGLPIVEDDAYRDLRFEGDPVPTLHAMDRDGLVIRMGTFSKIVAPGVRLGFVLAEAPVIDRVLAFKSEGSTNGFTSLVVGTFMRSGGLARHIAALRTAYRLRRDAMYRALEREMPEGVTWTRTEGGFFLWVTLPRRTDVAKVAARAEQERLVTLAGTDCFPDGRGTHNIRLAFSLQNEEGIAEGIRRLGVAIRAGL